MRTLIFGLIISTCISIGVAAEEAGPKPRFLAIIEEDIIPEHMETYMKTKVAIAKLQAQHEYEFPILTFMQDFRVTTVVIFKTFSQLDNFPQKWEAFNEKTGGNAKQLNKQIKACVSGVSSSIVVSRPDLSYFPKKPAFWPDFSQPCYQSVDIYHIKPGKYDEAEAVAKKLKEFNEKKQYPWAYIIEERIIGQDTSAFIAVAFAKDKAAFVNQDKEIWENPDPEFWKIVAEFPHVLAKKEKHERTFVPDASYVPEGTFE
jgi:hypothetical protein